MKFAEMRGEIARLKAELGLAAERAKSRSRAIQVKPVGEVSAEEFTRLVGDDLAGKGGLLQFGADQDLRYIFVVRGDDHFDRQQQRDLGEMLRKHLGTHVAVLTLPDDVEAEFLEIPPEPLDATAGTE